MKTAEKNRSRYNSYNRDKISVTCYSAPEQGNGPSDKTVQTYWRSVCLCSSGTHPQYGAHLVPLSFCWSADLQVKGQAEEVASSYMSGGSLSWCILFLVLCYWSSKTEIWKLWHLKVYVQRNPCCIFISVIFWHLLYFNRWHTMYYLISCAFKKKF